MSTRELNKDPRRTISQQMLLPALFDLSTKLYHDQQKIDLKKYFLKIYNNNNTNNKTGSEAVLPC